MKRLFATLGVFALRPAVVVPVDAGIKVDANGTAFSDSSGKISDQLLRVPALTEAINSSRPNPPAAGSQGAQRRNFVQSLKHRGLLTANGAVCPLVVARPEAVLAIQTQPAVLNPSTFSF